MRIPLLGGAYTAHSIIANAQRCVNLYPEKNPPEDQPPVPVTHYLTPGLTLLTAAPDGNARPARCVYRATNGNLYAVIGSKLYAVSSSFGETEIGHVPGTNPVSICDNGIIAVVVNGTSSGWTVNLSNNAFASISDAAFYGADRVDYVDTFFVFNRPNTQQFYVSPSNWDGLEAFDPLAIAAKTGYADPLQTLIVMHRELWLIGALTTEIWYDAGAPDFPFQIMPGTFVEHGTIAKYSICKEDLSVFWLSQDLQGQRMLLMGTPYEAKRISTHAIEAEWANYSSVTDAIAFTYQRGGHVFYQISFPAANKTWAYDLATGEWHERTWTSDEGTENRHRVQVAAFAYGRNVGGDWENGKLYALDPNALTDNGDPIVRRRGFPHLMNDGNRAYYTSFIADVEVGNQSDVAQPIYLRWSDTRGASWGNPIAQSFGATGEYLTQPQWNRLGMARDRVFELFWSGNVKTALNGAFIEVKPGAT